jgi:hypothetical protein
LNEGFWEGQWTKKMYGVRIFSKFGWIFLDKKKRKKSTIVAAASNPKYQQQILFLRTWTSCLAILHRAEIVIVTVRKIKIIPMPQNYSLS